MKKVYISLLLLVLVFGESVGALSLSPEGAKEYNAALFLADREIIKDVREEIDIEGTHYEMIGGGEMLAYIDAFRLSETITRKEVMKIVMKLSGLEIDNSCKHIFADVIYDWGCKYIESALESGFISSNSNFRPDDNITKTEAMKLVLKAKGIDKTQNTSAWQEDYMMTAYEYGIIDEKYTNYNDDASRGWIFTITTATIQREEELKQEELKEEKLMSDEA